MEQNLIKKDNIFTKKLFKDKESVLEFFSEILVKNGKVSDEFKEALLEREKNYPTGLLVGDINVAIPHADSVYVKESEILLCTLKNPIPFKRMDMPDEEVEVSIVILLAINSPDDHIEILQKIISLIQNQDILKKIFNESDNDKISEILSNFFGS
ncbi:PTS glucitol transporter subunit III [Tepidanaerobacter syntrophicus]|uniref:PTS sugar transporter subunit IIA n=1 Tax=Tepidanaerobacter syntrophicus TaxID=224999 RepID=UPI0022EE1E53|nr:PTS sugar transporter subunit IIA [Tepidanaerobacter syntrophicus]GLI20207.1 PTS glucitol transporter subunit III [Tepidanaerobacter syntrophicus]